MMRKDIGVLGKGKSDPYAIVTVGAESFRTPTIDNTVNPKWDYWCEVSVCDPIDFPSLCVCLRPTKSISRLKPSKAHDFVDFPFLS